MALPSRHEIDLGVNDLRCRACDADVLFLSTCPNCGAPTNRDSYEKPSKRGGGRSGGGGSAAVAGGGTRGSASAGSASGAGGRSGTGRAGRSGAASVIGASSAVGTSAAFGPSSAAGGRTGCSSTAGAADRNAIPAALLRAWEQPKASKGPSRLGQVRWRKLGAVSALIVVLGVAGATVAITRAAHPPTAATSSPLTRPAAATTPRIFAGEGFPFIAQFPVTPVISSQQAVFAGRSYTETTYTGSSLRSDVVVTVRPFPIGKPMGTAQTFLRRLAGRQVSTKGVRLRSGATTKVQGLPAVWIASTSEGGNFGTFGVIILDGHVAFEVIVGGPATTVTFTFSHVMHGFRIIDPSRGVVIF
jgi:hypothetical protein